jgi:tetratricopeptide (TPR) repeat protein
MRVTKPEPVRTAPVVTIVPSKTHTEQTVAASVETVAPSEPEQSLHVSTNENDFVPTAEETTEPIDSVYEPEPSAPAKPRETESQSESDRLVKFSVRGLQLKQARKLTLHASLLMRKGRYSDASIVLRDALRAFPPNTRDLTYGETLYKLGICLRRKGAPEQAIPVLQQALRFPYYRSGALREVEAATIQLGKVSRVKG